MFFTVIGWIWRLLIGGFFCANFLTSIFVVGWTYRWVQGTVLRGWWKESRFVVYGTFEYFAAALGPEAPVNRPRWFVRERFRAILRRPGPDGQPPGLLRWLGRLLTVPWYSLWLNLKIGLQGLFCTFLLTGWGCLVFSWEFGWLNFWSKDYEQAPLGPITGFFSVGLFILAMLYVPMAQIHQAVAGHPRAFFEFRLIWKLIHVRLTASVGLALLFALAGLLVQILKTAPAVFGNSPALEAASTEEVREILQNYLLGCSFVLFLNLLLLRGVAASIYRSAVLKALHRGRIHSADLPPVIAEWLKYLDLDRQPLKEPTGMKRALRGTGRTLYRVAMYGLLILTWSFFTAQVYVGEFFNYHPALAVFNELDPYANTHPFVGFANHPLVQLPCFDFVPKHLQEVPAPK